jgi:hypothetical protein
MVVSLFKLNTSETTGPQTTDVIVVSRGLHLKKKPAIHKMRSNQLFAISRKDCDFQLPAHEF